MPTYKRLRVWWIPQIPGEPFFVPVESVVEAAKVMKLLAEYDDFQYKNNIKPDYSNAGGLHEYRPDLFEDKTEDFWTDWMDDATGCDDVYEYLEEKGIHV